MLNLSNMIKNNRLIKLLLENSFMTPEVVSKMQHTDLHIIDLEEEPSHNDDDPEFVDSSRIDKIINQTHLSEKQQELIKSLQDIIL